MSQIKISVVIPTYHRNDLLAKCLDCLDPGTQTLSAEQYEVIVTDDGVKTTAEEMIRERYPWVKWAMGPCKGSAANRNSGVEYAQGEFIAFTDDDCLPSSTWLSAFSSDITADIHVYEGKTTCEAGIDSPLMQAPVNLSGGWLWSCNMMIRTSLFQELGGFDEGFPYPYMEDTEFRERLKKAGFTFPFVEHAVVDHPPRKSLGGNQLGASQESLVYYWRCKENRKLFKFKLIKSTMGFRVRAILGYPFSRDSIKAVFSMIEEVFYLIIHVNIWDKKYPYVQSKVEKIDKPVTDIQ